MATINAKKILTLFSIAAGSLLLPHEADAAQSKKTAAAVTAAQSGRTNYRPYLTMGQNGTLMRFVYECDALPIQLSAQIIAQDLAAYIVSRIQARVGGIENALQITSLQSFLEKYLTSAVESDAVIKQIQGNLTNIDWLKNLATNSSAQKALEASLLSSLSATVKGALSSKAIFAALEQYGFSALGASTPIMFLQQEGFALAIASVQYVNTKIILPTVYCTRDQNEATTSLFELSTNSHPNRLLFDWAMTKAAARESGSRESNDLAKLMGDRVVNYNPALKDTPAKYNVTTHATLGVVGTVDLPKGFTPPYRQLAPAQGPAPDIRSGFANLPDFAQKAILKALPQIESQAKGQLNPLFEDAWNAIDKSQFAAGNLSATKAAFKSDVVNYVYAKAVTFVAPEIPFYPPDRYKTFYDQAAKIEQKMSGQAAFTALSQALLADAQSALRNVIYKYIAKYAEIEPAKATVRVQFADFAPPRGDARLMGPTAAGLAA